MPTCVVCGWRYTNSTPHNVLDKLHLSHLVRLRSPTIAAEMLENQYKAVAKQ